MVTNHHSMGIGTTAIMVAQLTEFLFWLRFLIIVVTIAHIMVAPVLVTALVVVIAMLILPVVAPFCQLGPIAFVIIS